MYFLRLAIVVALVVGFLVSAFFIGRNAGNLYILASDGMKARATAILTPQDMVGELGKYFSADCLATQPVMRPPDWEDAQITAFDYRLSIKKIFTLPWRNTATVTVVESIPSMTGGIPTDKLDAADKPIVEPLPLWERVEYQLVCGYTGSRWIIQEVNKVAVLEPDPTPTGEPKVSIPPLPTYVPPTPAATAPPSGAAS